LECKCKEYVKAMEEQEQKDNQEMIEAGILVNGVDVNVTE